MAGTMQLPMHPVRWMSLSIHEVKAILDETSVGCQDRAELPLLTAHQGEEEELV